MAESNAGELLLVERVVLPFEASPCPCVNRHSPRPRNVDLHHVYPQGEQKLKHGSVIDRETVPLCKSGHDAVHYAITRLLGGQKVWLGNSYLQEVAEEGVRRIQS